MSETYAAELRDRLRRIIGQGVFVNVEDFLDEMKGLADRAALGVMTWAFTGQPGADEASPPVKMPYAAVLPASGGGFGAARTAATSSGVWTVYRGATPDAAGTAIATLTFTAADSRPLLVTTGGVDQALTTDDFIWGAWGSQDATLADVSCSLLLTKTA